MNTKKVCVLLVTLGVILNAASGYACSVLRIAPPEELVHNADLIVLATALNYAGDPPGNMRTTGVAPSRVRFRIESVLKGDHKASDVTLNGYLSDRDDWNDKTAPYNFVRPEGRHGSCFANMYRTGGQFVLMLKRNSGGNSAFQGDTEFTVNWAALAPVNEQVRSANDPWVQWVKTAVRAQNAKTFGVIFRSGGQEFTVTDPARLAEIEKKVDGIDFWNSTKYPAIVGGPFDETCDSRREHIDITAIRETVKTVTFFDAKCANTANNKPVQDLRSLIELIQKAAPKKP